MSGRSPELAVGAIVVVAERLLLVKRGQPPGKGLWTVPGGRAEPGERIEDAVEREVLEETGLDVTCGPLVGWVQRISADYNYVILDFAATPSGGGLITATQTLALRPGDDATAALWADDDRLGDLPLVPGLKEFLLQHGIVPLGHSSSSLADDPSTEGSSAAESEAAASAIDDSA